MYINICSNSELGLPVMTHDPPTSVKSSNCVQIASVVDGSFNFSLARANLPDVSLCCGPENVITEIIIHSKYFPVSDWLKPHA